MGVVSEEGSLDPAAISMATAIRAPWLPPLTSVQAFIAAANHLCFTRAASEIGITQSGVSRAIRGIEETIGTLLFERTGHGLVLTHAGQIYFDKVRKIVTELEDATYSLSAHGTNQNQLVIASVPSFGCWWLAPHIQDFIKTNPSVDLQIVSRNQPFELENSGINVAIHFGALDWPGAFSEHLMADALLPVCSPRILDRGDNRIKEPLLELPLIQHSHRPNAWREWFAEMGLFRTRPNVGLCFEQHDMALHAVLHGAGAALLPDYMVEAAVKSGELVQLYDGPQRTPWCYSLVYPEGSRSNRTIQKFRRWIKLELRKSLGKRMDKSSPVKPEASLRSSVRMVTR